MPEQSYKTEAVHLLTKCQNIPDITRILREILESDHCVIWKPSKRLMIGQELGIPFEKWRLYPWTSTFAQSEAEHSGLALEFANDTSGRMYLSYWNAGFETLPSKARTNNAFDETDLESLSASFMAERGLKKLALSFFHLPIGGAPYAVCAYRSQSRPDFSVSDIALLDQAVTFIPYLIDRFSNERLRSLLVEAQGLLGPSDSLTIEHSATETLDSLCEKIADSLHCKEATIILKSDNEGDLSYDVKGTTLSASELGKRRFKRSKEDGLTGYVLATMKRLEFHDLRNFKDPYMSRVIRDSYPDIDWKDSASIEKLSQMLYHRVSAKKQQLPPIAFLSVPILRPSQKNGCDKEILGLIRCSLGRGPYFFIPAEREVLELIAGSVGRWWANSMRAASERNRASLFRGLLDVQNALQEAISMSLSGKAKTGRGIIEQTATEIVHAFAGIKLVVFRRLDGDEGVICEEVSSIETYESRVAKEEWVSVNDCRMTMSAVLDGRPEPSPSWIDANEISLRGSPFEQRLVKSLEGIFSVPVIVSGEAIGVIDFGWSHDFRTLLEREQIQQVMTTLANQLSLHEQVKAYRERLAKNVENQVRMTNSLGHQVRSPVNNAIELLKNLQYSVTKSGYDRNGSLENDGLRRTVSRGIGTLRKAQSVGRFMEHYGRLTRGESLNLTVEPHSIIDLRKICTEVYKNNLAAEDLDDDMAPPELAFTGDIASSRGERSIVSSDAKLFEEYGKILFNREATEQVIDALIGNALKYGRINTAIEAIGEIQTSQFVLTIRNLASRGRILAEEDASNCFREGYRAKRMEDRPGIGLGLWLAERLMFEQGGNIEAKPTNEQSITQFSLFFPVDFK